MNLYSFIEKVNKKQSIVGVYGLGYVGLPLALLCAKAGYKVLGFDVDDQKISDIQDGQSYIEHISSDSLKKATDQGFEATSDFSRTSEADILVICVPTPLNKYREPDLSFVISTVKSMQRFIRPGQMISLESTTYPGTTDEEIVPIVRESNLKPGEDFFVVYSPEREDPGNGDYDTKSIPKVVGGYTSNCLSAGESFYSSIIDKTVLVSSTRAAEMTKLLENIHRSVNIGLVNEMKIVADKMGIDIFEVVDAAATKPFGFTPYYPGPGLGGHCIPIDPFYLTWKAREYGLHTRFIELSGEINKSMPGYVVSKLIEALNDTGKSLNGSNILVLGIAYKKNVDDVRESPAIEVMELLQKFQADFDYSDPHIEVFPTMREHNFDMRSVPVTAESIASYDAVVLTTDHALFDYDLIRENAKLVIDTRGKFRSKAKNIVKA